MHQTTVAKMESAARPIRLDEATACAAIFDVALHAMLSDPADDATVSALRQDLMTAEVRLAQCKTHLRETEVRLQVVTAEAQAARDQLVEAQYAVDDLRTRLGAIDADRLRAQQDDFPELGGELAKESFSGEHR